jgi:hypothetical protein
VDPVRPDYGGACLNGVARAVRSAASWAPEAVRDASAVVVFLIDGLGWNALESRRARLPAFASLDGAPITTVVPSTTTTALTSFTTGLPPAEHGILAYRLQLEHGLLNVLRWSMPGGGEPPDPEELQPRLAFDGEEIPVVTQAGFARTGFTAVHLRGTNLAGYHSPSSIPGRCRTLVAGGARFVYAYYGGLDLVLHMNAPDPEIVEAEYAFAEWLVARLLDALPSDVAVVVTADHGHVTFERLIELGPLDDLVAANSGESRFRYLHARPGAADELLAAAEERFGDVAWVFSRQGLIDEGLLGPRPPSPTVARRVGDVILAAREPIGFVDPNNPGEQRLLSGHGSLTPDEMLVPLLGGRGRR